MSSSSSAKLPPTSKKDLSRQNNSFSSPSSSSSFVAGSWHSGTSVSNSSKNVSTPPPEHLLSSTTTNSSNKQNSGSSLMNNSKMAASMSMMNQSGSAMNNNSSSTNLKKQQQTNASFKNNNNPGGGTRPKISFPIFNPVPFGQQQQQSSSSPTNKKGSSTFLTDTAKDQQNQTSNNNNSFMAASKPYTVEAAGNIPLVGEWLAQRRFLLFPRAPPVRDAIWCWSLLKSYVIRKDCMNEVMDLRTMTRQKRKALRNGLLSNSASGAASPVASPIGSPRRNNNRSTTNNSSHQQQQKKSVKILNAEESTEMMSPSAKKNRSGTNNISSLSTPTPSSQQQRRIIQNNQDQTSWVGTPSRNILQNNDSGMGITSPSAIRQRFASTPTPNSKSAMMMSELNGSSRNHNDESLLEVSPAQILANPKNSLESNKHAKRLHQALMSVERRKIWYEKFDASRRAERDSLSEKRQREAANKNAIKEWTWEEDEMLIARRLEQEERNALSRRLAREKLERIAHATKSLGISAPIVMADFSYMKIRYFFELLSLRPRNPTQVENLENIKMLKFGDPSVTKNKSDEELLEEEEKLSYVLEEDSFTRYILDEQFAAELPEKVNKMRRERPTQVVKTSNGMRVEDLSTNATDSELLKLYRRYLVAEGKSIDIWKEEDMGFSSASSQNQQQDGSPNQNENNNSNSDINKNNSSSAAAASSNQQNNNNDDNNNNNNGKPARLHPGDKNFNHFPTLVDKVSQRFYTRFLSIDFGKQISSQNTQQSILQSTQNTTAENEKRLKKLISTVSAGYLFDVETPPQLPYINGLKLKGNNLVDDHVVQFPNGNWRSLPAPVSSFHDMTFVLTVRCPLWRLTLVSLDLSENKLTHLPDQIIEIPKLHSLFLQGNNFTSLSSLEQLSEKRGAQMLRMSLYENPVINMLGPKDYANRIKLMFPLLSHLDNVYIPATDE